ncbi:sulfotransferase domain-containing protein [Candidatus Roizmanbacteria bacterium]|nr:sulfotransferase domain-containing protein [Candidatus Roizmanbacteria bacterium]
MKKLVNYVYDVERFGFSPVKIWNRLFIDRGDLPKILTVSIPKSGTNLLQRVLILHPMLYRRIMPTLGQRNKDYWSNWDKIFNKSKYGEIISSHIDYDESFENYIINKVHHKIVFITRDPRDIVISDMHYILKKKGHGYREHLMKMSSEKEMLTALILGDDVIRPINQQINRFAGWVNPKVHCVKFEDMVGNAGGGDDYRQRAAIRELYEFLGIKINDSLLEYIANNCRSSKTQTYRSGKINNWKKQFDDELKVQFKTVAGDLLIEMNYEKDHSW